MNAVEKKGRTQVQQPGRAEEVFIAPDVNIFELENGYVLEADMPGVTKDNLEVTLENNCVTIHGRRNDQPLPGSPLYSESGKVGYRRVFELDPMVDVSKIRATVNQGVLTLDLPKAEAVKPRKISIE